jgi:hypothetical protein
MNIKPINYLTTVQDAENQKGEEMNRIEQIVCITIGVMFSKGMLNKEFSLGQEEKLKEVVDGVNKTLDGIDALEAK